MTTHEPDASQTAREAAALLDRRIAAARPVPDFADMLMRARELAPGVVSEADVARAAALPPVIPPGHGERDDAVVLAPFAAALRAELDAKIAERRMASIPPVPMPRRRGRVGLVLGLAVALAAAVILVLVRPTQIGRNDTGSGVEASNQGGGGSGGEARLGDARPERYVLAAEPDAGVAMVVPVPSDSRGGAAAMPEPVVESRPVPADSPVTPRPRARTQPVEVGPSPSLEDEAQALWERGELAAAEQKLRQVLAVAGLRGRAELAYGDLFALVRQLRGSEGQVEVWREYLERFPAGRFADDVRAGLCQRAGAGQRAACWGEYLERHPQGIHRAQAEAALAEGSP